MFNLIDGYRNQYRISTSNFPDGTLSMKLDKAPNHIKYIEWKYDNDSELFTLMCLCQHYEKDEISLIMPYIPHARMDRVKSVADVFTLKAFAKAINSLNFKEVIVRDPHSAVAEALFDRISIESPKYYIEQAIEQVATQYNINTKDVFLFFPDEGSMKRYSNMFSNPYAYGMKVRDWDTGKIMKLAPVFPNGVSVVDAHVLIVDDICSRGGTFFHSASMLNAYNVNSIDLYVTHLEPSVFDGEMWKSDSVGHIYTTYSIFKPCYLEKDIKNKITIL